mgnify:CR=1 FL=1
MNGLMQGNLPYMLYNQFQQQPQLDAALQEMQYYQPQQQRAQLGAAATPQEQQRLGGQGMPKLNQGLIQMLMQNGQMPGGLLGLLGKGGLGGAMNQAPQQGFGGMGGLLGGLM